MVQRHDGQDLPPPEGEREQAARASVDNSDERIRVWKGFLTALQAETGKPPITYATSRQATQAHLGYFGDNEVLARVVYKLALDFGSESGAPGRTSEVLSRLGQGYVEAIGALRDSASTELNLPFLTTNSAGPVHYARTVTASDIAGWAESDPVEPPPPKRSFFARLFG